MSVPNVRLERLEKPIGEENVEDSGTTLSPRSPERFEADFRECIESFSGVTQNYQMRSLPREEAWALGTSQKNTLKMGLKDGFYQESLYRRSKRGTLDSEMEALLRLEERETFARIDSWIDNFLGVHFFQWLPEERDRSLAMKCSELGSLYESIHLSGLGDVQKLFFEFYIGLTVVFRLNTLASVRLIQESNLLSLDASLASSLEHSLEELSNDFWEHLIQCKDLALMMQTILFADVDPTSFTLSHCEKKWKLIYDLVIHNPYLHQALEFLCSMRYIPQDKSFLLMAQILHWRGFGNEGEWLQDIPVLKAFLELPIRYHGGRKRGHFGGREILEKMFLPLLGAVRSRQSSCLEACGSAMEEYFQARGAGKMVVMDCGSGKDVSAVRILKKQYLDRVHLIATDGCGDSLSQIHENPIKVEGGQYPVDETIYQDINMLDPLSGQERYGSCHLLSTFLVLHQCMDHVRGDDVIENFFSYATRVLQVGGIWFWGDTGDVAYLQGLVIPANLVDREGYVPNNFHKFLKNLDRVAVPHEGRFRLLLPLKDLHFSTPESLASSGGIYTFNAFLNVEIEEGELWELQRAKDRGEWRTFDEKTQEIVRAQDRFGMLSKCREKLGGE